MIAYLRETSAEMERSGYTLDCVTHACRIAELLLEAGRAPWIGRLRDRREHPRGVFHAPLTPLRFPARTWTTHYVCCAGGEVYDPIAGEPVPLAEYGQRVFGRPLEVQELLGPAETAELLRRGELRKAIQRRPAPFTIAQEVEHGQRQQRAEERNEEAEEG